jgi:hypothetical protein
MRRVHAPSQYVTASLRLSGVHFAQEIESIGVGVILTTCDPSARVV